MFPLQKYGLLNENLRVNRIPSYEFLVKEALGSLKQHTILLLLLAAYQY